MGKNTKYWTVGALRGRGWTERLLDTLLPKPHYWHQNGKRVRSWPRDVVMEAEKTAEFQAAKAALALQQQTALLQADEEVTAALQRAASFLNDAWDFAQKPEGAAAILARHYHDAIEKQIPTVVWADRLKTNQALSYVNQFLALADPIEQSQQYSILRRFLSAAVWLGRNVAAPVSQRLYAGYGKAIGALAARETAAFAAAQPEADLNGLLMMPRFPVQELLSHSLGYLYSVYYVPAAIRTSLQVLMALNPKDEYPDARAMQRHFIIHLGGTNTGKTYAGFQRLLQVKTGVYLAPLRLLALEAQERMLHGGVRCSLSTGEEEDSEPGDTHVAATAEKLNLKARYDAAVIDECQMITDAQRGYAWTRAILGVLAPEVHLCAAPQAKNILIQLIKSCGDSYEIVNHERKTPLLCMKQVMDFTAVQPGDALITFSKVGVLSVAEDLRHHGKEPAIIYGALPYSTRRRQMEGFLDGRMEYVVSTDAIGMGLNLPIRRIIFMDTEKFDGTEQRELKPEEVQQIAGRAGRYGMYDRGYVGATENIGFIRAALETVVPQLSYAVVGFSELVLQVDFDLLEVLEQWNRMPTVSPYRKLDISRYLSIISRLRDRGFHLDKEQELRAANIPFDETEGELCELFYHFMQAHLSGETIARPEMPPDIAHTLPELELYCRKLDLYFSFSKAFGIAVDTQALYEEREQAADEINEILLYNLKNNIRFCSLCGASLPLHHNGKLCPACFRKRMGRR